jgi:glucose-1-phosphate adenylyltransferase
VDGGSLSRTVVADGASVCHATVEDSIVGLRMQVSAGATVKRAVLLGADEYDDRQARDGMPPLGIGHDAVLENVIVDKNARIGDGAVLVNSAGIIEGDGPGYVIREGIIVVPKGGVVPAGTKVGQAGSSAAAGSSR